MLIDSHCHFNNLSKITREDILSSCGKDYFFIDSSIDLESSRISLDISKNNSSPYTALGFHPFSGEKFSENTLADYEALINSNKKVVALGEVGLDYKADIAIDRQEEILREFLALAKKKDLAAIIHIRFERSTDTGQGKAKILSILDDFFSTYERVVFHCFSYSVDFLKEIVKRRGNVSFSLNILRKNKDILASLAECPLDNLILETDSPYMKIEDKSSTPLDIDKVYLRASEIKAISLDKLKGAVFANVRRIFSLKI